MAIKIENINRKKTEAQMYRAILRTTQNALYKNRNQVAAPMASISRAIEDILRSHLGVSANGYSNVGVASGILRSRLKVINGELQYTGDRAGILFGGETFTVSMQYQLDLESRGLEYGYPIGAEEGYRFSPSVPAITAWILKKGKSNFTYQDSKLRHKPVRTKAQARRAAFAINKGNYGKATVVLPNWYLVNDRDDLSQVDAMVSRTSNLYMQTVGKEITIQNKRRNA